MAINWGSEFGSGNYIGKLGIETVVSAQTNTQITITNYVYYRSKYAVTDSSNNFYVDWDSYADTSIGAKSISHPSNSAWNESNKTYIGAWTATFNKTTSAQTKYFSARCSGIEYGGGGGTHYVSFTVPALPTYTVNYNGNGGSGAPSSQTKTHGVNLTLSATKPTWPGHTFLGWGTSASDTSVDYSAGGTYSTNTSITLYAIWELNTYTVSFNANNGSGGPSSQTKTYGKDLTLSSTIPVRKGYKFLGWGTSSTDTTVDYDPGSIYKENASITLFAIWKKVENMAINVDGTWKKGMASIGGKKGTPYIKVNGVWKKGGA